MGEKGVVGLFVGRVEEVAVGILGGKDVLGLVVGVVGVVVVGGVEEVVGGVEEVGVVLGLEFVVGMVLVGVVGVVGVIGLCEG